MSTKQILALRRYHIFSGGETCPSVLLQTIYSFTENSTTEFRPPTDEMALNHWNRCNCGLKEAVESK